MSQSVENQHKKKIELGVENFNKAFYYEFRKDFMESQHMSLVVHPFISGSNPNLYSFSVRLPKDKKSIFEQKVEECEGSITTKLQKH